MKISIIIPTLNEEKYLRSTIEHARNSADQPEAIEFIVVDAGSSDKTVRSIDDLPCRVFTEQRFQLRKYESLNFGMAKASNEIVLFLDADTCLPQHFDSYIREKLAQRKVVGGAFEMRFMAADFKLNLLAQLNALRYRVWKNFYGDQAIFCLKKEAIKVGGFPETLMEAAYFCKSIQRYGKLALIRQPVLTSPRRFIENGFWKVLWFDIRMWLRFVFNYDLKMVSTEYWKTNLENG